MAPIYHLSVHLKLSEKMSLVAGRDGGLQNMEVLGMIMLRITDPDMAKIRIAIDNREERSVQFQVRPDSPDGCSLLHVPGCASISPSPLSCSWSNSPFV